MKQICWLWGLVGVCAYASTWVVPEEIPTIQMALNISADGDTILVQPGVYSEALLAPNGLFFVMIGIFDTTKENDEWPIIDPSLLDSSDRKACLRLPSQTSAVIKNIWFRNRWPMFPRVDNAVGGIYNQCLDLTVKNCRFDSTYRSLSANSGVLLVEDCEFIHHVSTAIIKEQATFPAVIRNSSFTSNTAAIHTIGNTLVEECYFHETEATHWINAWGSGITFRACTFDAALSPVHGVIWVTGSGSGLVFEDNIFDQFRVMGGGQIIEFQQSGNDSIVLRGNEFRDILNINDNAATLRIEYHDNFFYVAENRFVNCTGGFARGIVMTNVNALVTANEFIGSSEFDPYVYARRSFNNDLRINLQGFAETGYALEGDGTWDIDARNCWWGDSTGQYHVTRSPAPWISSRG